MKKLICLALSLMMVMSMVVVPVAAEEAAESNYELVLHLKAENTNSTGTKNANGTITYSGTTWSAPKMDGTVNGNNAQIYTRIANTADLAGWPIESRMVNVYINPEEFEGYAISGASQITDPNLEKNYFGSSGLGVAGGSKQGWFAGKDLRVDSVRFKMPAVPEDHTALGTPITLLFGMNGTGFAPGVLNGTNALRLKNGLAYTVDRTNGSSSWYNFLPEGTTMDADKWYRAERILDTRIKAFGEDGKQIEAGTENWQRFIIYDDATNALVGDSGWVWTGVAAGDATSSVAFGAANYPADTYLYVEDIKCYTMAVPESDYLVGDDSQNPKFLTFPANATSSYLQNMGISYSLHSGYYFGSDSNKADVDGDGVVDKYGVNGDHRAEVKAISNALKTNDYIYFQQDFMIPEVNTRNFGLMDLHGGIAWNVQGTGGKTHMSPIRIASGVLTVNSWDYSTSSYSTTAVNDEAGVPFSITLEPGKWYTALLVVDREGKDISNTLSGGYPAYAVTAEDGSVTHVAYANSDTTKAYVVITDADGNEYKTEEFTYKSLRGIVNWGMLSAVIMADAQMPTGTNTTAPSGFKVNLDNQKIVISDGAMDAEGAVVALEDDFQSYNVGTNVNETQRVLFNAASSTNYEAVANGGCNVSTAVSADRTAVNGIPTEMKVIFGEEIKTDLATLQSAVKLYQGETEVNELIESLSYDDATNTLTVAFTALEPETSYKLTVDRSVAEVDNYIYSVLPGETGKTAEFPFTPSFAGSESIVYKPVFESMGMSLDEAGGIQAGMPIDSVSSTLKNYNDYEAPYVVVAALYDENGKMEDVIAQTGTLGAKGTETATAIINFANDTLDPVDAVTLKSFVWNTWSLMTPIADVYVYPAAE